MDYAHLRPILGYLPRYAFSRRDGWTPPDSTPLADYVLLRRVAIERGDEPIPFAALQTNALNPYSTIDSFLDGLPRLVELGLLDQSGDSFMLTPTGRNLLTRGERDANNYAKARMHLPPCDLERLAATLTDIAERQRNAPEPAERAHQDRVPFLRRFDSRQTAPVQMEYAIYALQRARDDAHIASWRAVGLQGPEIELLSLLWTADARTEGELVEMTQARMRPSDVPLSLGRLKRKGYATVEPGTALITDLGREVRTIIECETDRIYFTPWPEIDLDWVFGRLETLVARITSPSQTS